VEKGLDETEGAAGAGHVREAVAHVQQPLVAGRLGELQVVNGSEVLLGAPFVFNAENIGDFDF
jgi:hypothetical protein